MTGRCFRLLRNKKILFVSCLLIIGLYISMGYVSQLNEDDDYSDEVDEQSSNKEGIKSPTGTQKSLKLVKKYIKRKPNPRYNVHIFYYPWYGNPNVDKDYIHWNHQNLPHWSPEIAKRYPTGAHKPPDDIASNYYPGLGPYSSKDPNIIKRHMQQLSFSGVGVIAVSYYPPGLSDDSGEDWQSIFPDLLDAADKYKLKVAFHIEPYHSRTELTVKEDIKHIIDSYSQYPAFYKLEHGGKTLPLIYIYDSYHTEPQAWSKLFLLDTSHSIRGTKYDCFAIGLLVEEKHQKDVLSAGFDGFYTYFASSGFTFGSSRENWETLNDFAIKNNLMFIPSVGPGYVDTRVRPWNEGNTRKRLGGKYYKESWMKALSLVPEIISITSFNEWHEGTQIEEAVPKNIDGFKYLDYLPEEPHYYLLITKAYVQSFFDMKKKESAS